MIPLIYYVATSNDTVDPDILSDQLDLAIDEKIPELLALWKDGIIRELILPEFIEKNKIEGWLQTTSIEARDEFMNMLASWITLVSDKLLTAGITISIQLVESENPLLLGTIGFLPDQ